MTWSIAYELFKLGKKLRYPDFEPGGYIQMVNNKAYKFTGTNQFEWPIQAARLGEGWEVVE